MTITATVSASTVPASTFPFLAFEDIHHRLQCVTDARLAKCDKSRTEVVIAARSQICGCPEAADKLIAAIRQLPSQTCILIDEVHLTIEVFDLNKFGQESTLRACGKRPC